MICDVHIHFSETNYSIISRRHQSEVKKKLNIEILNPVQICRMVSYFLSNQTHKNQIFPVGKKMIENQNETKTLGFTRTDTLTPESEPPGTEFSGTVSMISFRLRGFEDGGLGGRGLLNLAGDCFESCGKFGSDGGAFSFVDLGFLDGLGLAKLGLSDDG
jgi:hypothetical protein